MATAVVEVTEVSEARRPTWRPEPLAADWGDVALPRQADSGSLRSIETWLSLEEAIACLAGWQAGRDGIDRLSRCVRHLDTAVERMRCESWTQHASLTAAVVALLNTTMCHGGPRQVYTLGNAERVLRALQDALSTVGAHRPQVPGFDVLYGLISELQHEERAPH